MDTCEITPGMPVVCAQGGQFATVDHLENNASIKLQKDEYGKHHYIPTSWVLATDNGRLVIDRPGYEAMQQWTESPIK
jgi:hypothetical protein